MYLRLRICQEGYAVGSFEGDSQKLRQVNKWCIEGLSERSLREINMKETWRGQEFICRPVSTRYNEGRTHWQADRLLPPPGPFHVIRFLMGAL